MTNNLQVFKNTEFGELGVLVIDGKEYFPASECARILGYSNPRDAILRHCKPEGVVKHDGVSLTTNQYGISTEQMVEKTYITEGNLYRLIIRSKLPAAERFERWIFDEVLPTIRKHGLYATEKVLDEILADPDYGIRLFSELKAERERRKALEMENAQHKQIIGELRPKASYYDLILQNKSLVPISKIAKDYGMSGKAFNKLLHELGVQYKMGDTWLLYQQYADQGYTQSRTHAIDAEKSRMHTYWTQKGRLFLYDLLKNRRGLLPMIERNGKTA
ncbi:Bacteriophage P1, Ant1, C-terminal [Syntrophomonas zehnderi OL-4]|jgi:prophage antirepressor-like protein|uniref:Bacteriophage P1, Ant1, C-terminal n=1 Tax=Syntrophomonas zehnderi OL-4 TaxID=690567 RepID=A0A0E4C8V7_9FIRM|nr:phage antirepressor KilAC domain-containing protein [Syntrophomonas zehnderi]CFX73647.1 Bacteriophage P1, Ant1, C-terminal [Syntrophomonas zehnderi OL-4]